jgi:hypothetical protein
MLNLKQIVGYVNQKQFAASLDAFCHWTFDATNGYLMVVDIQVPPVFLGQIKAIYFFPP